MNLENIATVSFSALMGLIVVGANLPSSASNKIYKIVGILMCLSSITLVGTLLALLAKFLLGRNAL